MSIVLFSLALLTSQPVTPVSDHVPRLTVEATCKETTAVDQAMKLAEAQSLADCLRDETSAQQQLGTIWQTTPVSIRDRCEGEAVAAGLQSYVDLLTCIQLTDTANLAPSPAPLRGASRNRNAK
jgi:hypothetical protein